ncbi:Uu.00g025660.m01.CDS01 [Anthostomella pinea]|uniref:Uu.00g025660.m01.CDS01 n=1 Tax=Anthostomella pinea TaxID=933095 RepID=A0AAI8YCN3_9PEZI|nr:Uu.00g025660.m01.CDS01 [Anthostomella pinea]
MFMSEPSLQESIMVINIRSMHLASLTAPLHLLSYSALLGTQLYQTFIVTKICYDALPRSAFTTLQKRLFPIYFRVQSLLLLLTVVTVPPQGPLTLVANKAAWIPFTIAGVTALLNLMVYGPRTRDIMIERVHQATRDARNPDDVTEVSMEMQKLNRTFSRNHAMSIHLNLISIGATLFWGWRLALRLDFS